jgi:uncharacterized protein YsxB (DUF464 family)
MITCKVTKRQGIIIAIDVQGHANSGPSGHDLICASVSVLMQTLALGLNNVMKLKAKIDFEPRNGSGKFNIQIPFKRARQAHHMTKTFTDSLQILARDNPKYLKVEVTK